MKKSYVGQGGVPSFGRSASQLPAQSQSKPFHGHHAPALPLSQRRTPSTQSTSSTTLAPSSNNFFTNSQQPAPLARAYSSESAHVSATVDRFSQESAQSDAKRQRDDENDFQGLYKVSVDRNRLLEKEIGTLKQDLLAYQIRFEERVQKELAAREAALAMRERDLDEQKDILKRTASEVQKAELHQSRTLLDKTLENEKTTVSREREVSFTFFFESVKEDVLRLLRISKDSSKAGSSNTAVTTTSPLALRNAPPSTPLVGQPPFSSPLYRLKTEDFTSKGGDVLLKQLYEVLLLLPHGGSDFKQFLDVLIAFLEDIKGYPASDIEAVMRVLRITAVYFAEFRSVFLSSERAVQVTLRNLVKSARIPNVVLETLRTFLALVEGRVCKGDQTSIKPLESLVISNGILAELFETLEDKTCFDLAYQLISWILTAGGDATPPDFPEDSNSWVKVIPPFLPTRALNVQACMAILSLHGKSGAKFLYRHGILSALINHMSEMEQQGTPQPETVFLLFNLMFLTEVEATPDECKRLMLCLLSIKDLPPSMDFPLTIPQVDCIMDLIKDQVA